MKAYILHLLCLVFICKVLTSCSAEEFDGSDTIITVTRDLPVFNKIITEDIVEVEVIQGDIHLVEITVNDNLVNQLRTIVSNNTLRITMEDGSYDNAVFIVSIQTPDFERLQLNDKTKGTVNYDANQLEFEVGGLSVLNLQGNADLTNISIRDAGTINGFSFTTNILNATLRDATELNITCDDEMNGTVKQAAELRYRGSPTINAQTADAGQIINAN